MIGVWIGEQRVKVHLFVMVLGFSRRIFVRAYEHETAREPAGRSPGSLQPLRRQDGDAAVRQPADDRAVEGRG